MGINLQGVDRKDIENGYILTNSNYHKSLNYEDSEIIIRASFIYTFNGIY